MACARFDGYLDRVCAREGSRKHKPIIKGRHFPPVMGKYKIADANTLPVRGNVRAKHGKDFLL